MFFCKLLDAFSAYIPPTNYVLIRKFNNYFYFQGLLFRGWWYFRVKSTFSCINPIPHSGLFCNFGCTLRGCTPGIEASLERVSNLYNPFFLFRILVFCCWCHFRCACVYWLTILKWGIGFFSLPILQYLVSIVLHARLYWHKECVVCGSPKDFYTCK